MALRPFVFNTSYPLPVIPVSTVVPFSSSLYFIPHTLNWDIREWNFRVFKWLILKERVIRLRSRRELKQCLGRHRERFTYAFISPFLLFLFPIDTSKLVIVY